MLLVIGEIVIEFAMVAAIVGATSLFVYLIVATVRERRERLRFWRGARAETHEAGEASPAGSNTRPAPLPLHHSHA